MTHTPGPWRTNSWGMMNIGIYDEKYPAVPRYGVHVEFYPLHDDVPELEAEEYIANMKIMGDSLALLEACKEVLAALDAYAETVISEKTRTVLETAIAKAEVE